MSIQAIVPFSINGENFFTHTSWFSEKQYNGWSSVPEENKNLAFYYSLSTISLVGIVSLHLFSSSGEPLLSSLCSPATEDFSLGLALSLWGATSDGLAFSSRNKVQNLKDLSQETIVAQLLFGKTRTQLSISERRTIKPSWIGARERTHILIKCICSKRCERR